jgi:hypothetical protein
MNLIVSYLTYILWILMSHLLYYDDNGSIDDNENTHLIKLKDVRYFGKQIKVCLWIEYTHTWFWFKSIQRVCN